MIKLVVVDPDPQFAKEIEHLLEERTDMTVTAAALDLNQALISAERQQPQVMIIGPGLGADMATTFVKKLTARFPIGCILFAYNASAKLKMAAMRANVVEVIQVPAEPERIIYAIKTAAGYAEQLSISKEVVEEEHKCAAITVFSTKGGVGKTVLSTNIATSIANMYDGRVVLVDLDLQFGDVGIAMGLTPKYNMLEFHEQMLGADDEKIESMLVRHKSGLWALLAPKEPEKADLIQSDCVNSVISTLKEYADFIVIDTPASFNDNVLAVLDQSDEVCVVLTMDMPSVKNVKLCFNTLNDLKYAREKQKMVINRVESNIGLKVQEIEKVLGMRAVAKIHNDKAVTLSLNKGIPVVLDAPKSATTREIIDLAGFYVGKYRPDWVEMRLSG